MTKKKHGLLVGVLILLSQLQTGCSSGFKDGEYEWEWRVARGDYKCSQEKASCLSLKDAEKICKGVSGITRGLSENLHWTQGGAMARMLKEMGPSELRGRWLDKGSFKSEHGIIGGCEVEITVSGIWEGSTRTERGKVVATYFVVRDGKIMIHEVKPSFYM